MDAETVRNLFDCDPLAGTLRWRKSRGGVMAGSIAGTRNKKDYIVVKIAGRMYQAHRIIWLHQKGIGPSDQIDHINGIRYDNCLDNLRLANNFQNAANRKTNYNNACGAKGVHYRKRDMKWYAQIFINGKPKHIGSFATKEMAADAYREASLKHHGEYSVFHNQPAA